MGVKTSKVLLLNGQVLGGKISYTDDKANERFQEFKRMNDGAFITVIYEAQDAVQYFQHKYFHGYVLPQIAEAMGDKDLPHVKEFVLKEQGLMYRVDSLRDIPRKHAVRCRIISREYVDEDGEIKSRVVGYVPSTSVVGYKRMKEFIEWCESIRDGLIDWSILEKNKSDYDEMMRLRSFAMTDALDDLVNGGE